MSHVEIPYEPALCESSYHLYVLRILFDEFGKSRNQMVEALLSKGIGTQVHYIPLHMQPYYKNTYHYREGDLPVAESYYKKAISLPIYFAMTDMDIEKVINSVMECLNVK